MKKRRPATSRALRAPCGNCGDADIAQIAAASAARNQGGVVAAPGGEMLLESILGERVPHEDPDSRSFYLWDLDDVPCH